MSSLLFPIAPYADESVMGIVHRAAIENVHGTTWPILSKAGVPHLHNYDFMHDPTVVLTALADTLGLPLEDLTTRILTPSDDKSFLVNFGAVEVPRYDLVWRYRRVAPAVLERSPYHRAIWNHGLIPFCLDSGEILIDRCPKCQHKLGFYFAEAIDECEKCHAKLSKIPGARISDELRHAVRPMTDFFRDQAGSGGHVPMHADLASLQPGEVFELGWRLGLVFSKAEAIPRHRNKSYPASTKIEIIGVGAKLLSGWPSSLQLAFDAERASNGAKAVEKVFKRFRYLLLSPSAWASHRELVRRTIGHNLSAPHLARRTLLSDHGMTASEAIRKLGIGEKAFNRLRAHLHPTRSYGTVNQFEHFSNDEIAELANVLSDRVTAGAVAERLGVSYHGVEQLCCSGLISPVEDKRIQDTFRDFQIVGTSVDRFCTDLYDRLLPSAEGEALIALRRAVDIIGAREKPWAAIFHAILSGSLTTFKGATSKRYIQHAEVRLTDLRQIADMSFATADFPHFEFATTINQRDSAEILNVLPRHSSGIFRNELPKVLGKGGHYPKSAILALARQRISGLELKRRWFPDISRPQFGYFDPFQRLGASGFCRETVEAYMARQEQSQ